MIRLVADENFNGAIIRGVLQRDSNVDLVRMQDVGLRGVDDSVLLDWAARHDRLVLTHDVNSLVGLARQRVLSGLPMPGVFVLSGSLPFSVVIEEVLILALCSQPDDWNGRIAYFPIFSRG